MRFQFDHNILLRGTSNPLIPSLVEKCSNDCTAYDDLANKESKLLEEFYMHSDKVLNYYYKNDISKDWEKRYAAREHGLASSLMDWTRSLEIAVEFAIHNFENKEIDYTTIWILKTISLPQIQIDEQTNMPFNMCSDPTIINFSFPSDYHSKAYSRRMFIQGGLFLKQPWSFIGQSIDENSFYQDKLAQIIIPKDAITKIRSSLSNIIDLSQSAMPSGGKNDNEPLDDICKQLNKKYK